MLRIYAPASSANISVGFDTLGGQFPRLTVHY